MSMDKILRADRNDAREVATAGRDIRYVPQKAHLDFCGIAHETRYAWVADHLPLAGRLRSRFWLRLGVRHLPDGPEGRGKCTGSILAEAIAFARKSYGQPHLQYSRVDACGVHDLFQVLAPGTFDFVVSFDVIEHIEKYFDYLENASRLLKKDGQFVLSTPNRLQTFNWNSHWNPCHFQEFSAYQLRRILGLYFARVGLMAQDFRDSEKKQALQRECAHRKAMKELDPLARMVRKTWHSVAKRVRRGAYPGRETIHYSDILFSWEPGDAVLDQAFGLMAVCEQPREAPSGCPRFRRGILRQSAAAVGALSHLDTI